MELFNIWLDSGKNWDKVAAHFEREQASQNLSRKQWTAIQAKELKKRMSEERFKDLIEKRTSAGLYYQDADYPNDPEERGCEKCGSYLSRL